MTIGVCLSVCMPINTSHSHGFTTANTNHEPMSADLWKAFCLAVCIIKPCYYLGPDISIRYAVPMDFFLKTSTLVLITDHWHPTEVELMGWTSMPSQRLCNAKMSSIAETYFATENVRSTSMISKTMAASGWSVVMDKSAIQINLATIRDYKNWCM